MQRHLLYVGEINDSQKAAWTKVTEVFDPVGQQTQELALYPAGREVPEHAAHYGVQVYVLAESKDRVNKERSMRRRQLKGLVKRLKELMEMELTRDQLLLKLGAAKNQFPAAWRLVTIQIPVATAGTRRPNFAFALRRDKLRQVRRRQGRYLLRSNLSAQAPEKLWQFYIQLTQVEAAFKDLKDDLSLRP
ncbi:MAG: hypothetical protein KGR98_13935, partial [Verrucomicrobia bacterium]|nr:hypothetical protein [Verrucomicrobiota bacterium]